MFPAVLVGGILGSGLPALSGKAFSWPSSLPFMDVAACFVVIPLLVPTRANRRGLRLLNAWGVRRAVAWSDIAEVRFAKLMLMPSLRIRTKDGRVFWLPRDTGNLDQLYQLAVAASGEQHPLARALGTPFCELPY